MTEEEILAGRLFRTKEAREARKEAIKERKEDADARREEVEHQSKLRDISEKFNEARLKTDTEARNKEMIEKGKVTASTIKQLKLNGSLMSGLEKGLGKMITNSGMSLDKQLETSESITKIMDGNLSAEGIQEALQSLAKEVGHLPGAVKMLTEASKDAKKNESKLDKLKEKERKRDEFLKKFSFENGVKKVKEFAVSTFDKIKDLIIKGALLALLLNIPKILDSQVFKDILAYITEGEFEKDILYAWNNYILPAFDAIKASIVFLKNLLTGDFETAWKTFKDDWLGITVVLGITFGSLIATMWIAVSALASVVSTALVALAPFTGLIALVLGIAALLGALIYNIFDIGVENTIKWAGLLIVDAFAVLGNLFLIIANAINSVVDGIIDAGNWILQGLGFEGIKFRFGQSEMMSTNRAETFRSTKSAEVNGIKDTIAELEANPQSASNSAKLTAAIASLDEAQKAFDFINSNGTSNRGNVNIVKGGDNNSTNVNTVSNGNTPVTVMDDFGSILSPQWQVPTGR